MGEITDSRTAAFDRKRGADEAFDSDRRILTSGSDNRGVLENADNEYGNTSSSSENLQEHLGNAITPQKRRKYSIDEDGQGIRNQVPILSSNTTMSASTHADRTQVSSDMVTHDESISTLPASSVTNEGAAPSINWNGGARAVIRTSLGGGRLQSQKSSDKSATNTPQRATERSGVLIQTAHGPNNDQKQQDNADKGSNILAKTKVRLNTGAWKHRESRDAAMPNDDDGSESENNQDILLNVQNDEPESGEVTESNHQTMHEGQDQTYEPPDIESGSAAEYEIPGLDQDANDGTSEESSDGVDDNDEEEEDKDDEADDDEEDDPMMDYANADASITNSISNNTQPSKKSPQPLTLVDLEPGDLQLQIRYFHATKDPLTVDYSTLARCLVCTASGHLSSSCPALTCTTCNAHSDHTTRECPLTQKCSKCRAPGHSPSSCPYKLKRLNPDEIECSLCERTGHPEESCELIWRTSGRPWESDCSTDALHIYCYECGNAGHLGNDCPTRQPGKPLGSSTWSMNGKSALLHLSKKAGISIRGRAQQQVPTSDSEDDHSSFLRPKVPNPTRSGQIRVNAPTTHHQDSYQPTRPQNDYHEPNRYYPPDTYYPNDIRNQPQAHNYAQSLQPPRQYVSYPGRYDGPGEDDISHPEPVPKLNRRQAKAAKRREERGKGGTYRPMPSAGEKAWRQHRI